MWMCFLRTFFKCIKTVLPLTSFGRQTWTYHPWSPDPRWFLLQLGHPHHPHMAQQDTLRRSLGWEAIPSRWLCPTFLRMKNRWREFGNDGNTHESGGWFVLKSSATDRVSWLFFHAARAHRHRPVCPELPSRRWLARRCRNDRKGHQHAPWRQIMTNVVISILHYTSKKKPSDQNWKKLQWFSGVSLITV